MESYMDIENYQYLQMEDEITMEEEKLKAEANKWELSHGGISGRTAQQFINYLLGQGILYGYRKLSISSNGRYGKICLF